MKFILAGLLTLSALSLDSCHWVDDILKSPVERAVKASVAEATRTTDTQLAQLAAQAATQSLAIEQVRREVEAAKDELKKKIEIIEMINEMNADNYKSGSAKITSDGSGYNVARTNLGPAIITLKGLTPYLDGFKIRLWVTVLAPIEINGIKGTISWVEKDPDVRKKDNTAWREKPFTVASTFVSGRYTEIEVALTPASAAGLKEMYVALKTDQINVGVPRP